MRTNFLNFVVEMRNIDDLFEEENLSLGSGLPSSLRDDLQLLVQDWVNLVFSFLVENRLDEDILKAQELTFKIIR